MTTVSLAYLACLNVCLSQYIILSFTIQFSIDDPEFPIHKANYRDFLRHSTRYHQPVTIHDPLIQKKIHHTYRLLFLKDVVLARALDDSTFNVLSSCIIFNQIDIITHVQNDVQFLQDIVDLFLHPNPSIYLNGAKNKIGTNADTISDPMSNGVDVDEDRRCREVILLIQQLCIMGKNVQLPTRMALFKTLVDRGIVHAVQWALSQPEGTEAGQQMIAVAGEVLITLLDHDASGVREHVVKQCEGFETRESRDESLLTLLCGLMVRSRDLAVQTLVGDSLRLMLEMPPPEANEAVRPSYLSNRTSFLIFRFWDSKHQPSLFLGQGMTLGQRNSSTIFTNFVYTHSSNPSLTSRITNNTCQVLYYHLVTSSVN
jgi:protein phosphatase-4 regulatory subunit 3